MNKKAALEDIFVGPFAVLALLMLLLIFWVIFVSGCGPIKSLSQETTIPEEISNTTSITMLNYLRTPVEVDGNKLAIADLIALSVKNEKYKPLLESKTKEIIDSIKPATGGWNIYIKDDSTTILEVISNPDYTGQQEVLYDDSVTIPLYDKNVVVRMNYVK